MFLFDTHVHTSEVSPCGSVPADEIVKLYKKAGFSGLLITDHYYSTYFENLADMPWKEKINCYLTGYRAAKIEGKKQGIDVLLGAELKFDSKPNDYLLFGISEDFLYRYPNLNHYSIQSFYRLAKDNDILVFQAHPFRPGLIKEKPDYLDGVEVYNGNPRHHSHNDMALQFAEENNLLKSSGSDCHEICDVGRGGIKTKKRVQTIMDLKHALINQEAWLVQTDR